MSCVAGLGSGGRIAKSVRSTPRLLRRPWSGWAESDSEILLPPSHGLEAMLRCISKLSHTRAALGKVRHCPLNKFSPNREPVLTQCCPTGTSGGSFSKGMIQDGISRVNDFVPIRSKCIRSSATLIAVSRRFLSSSHGGYPQGLKDLDSSTASAVVPELLQSISLENVIQSASVDPVPTGWSPASLAEFGIVAIHDAFGLPWCLSIAGITVVLRAVLFPLVVYQVGDLVLCNTIFHGMKYVALIDSVISGCQF